jgi:hypothetical protein
MLPSGVSSSFVDKGAAKMFLDNRSRTTLRSPTISRTKGPMIKRQLTNRRIDDDPSCNSDGHEPQSILALIKKGVLVRAYSDLIKSAAAMG